MRSRIVGLKVPCITFKLKYSPSIDIEYRLSYGNVHNMKSTLEKYAIRKDAQFVLHLKYKNILVLLKDNV